MENLLKVELAILRFRLPSERFMDSNLHERDQWDHFGREKS
jgi:hypothetical protein